MFRTEPVGLGSIPAMYQLSIRSPGPTFSEIATYTFPITPSQLRMDFSSLSSFTDTQGPPISRGVTRVMDTYGLAPPVYTLEGTTGYDRHMSDGFVLSGIQSMLLLNQFLAQYVTMNQVQRVVGNPQLFTLEFYDYYMNQYLGRGAYRPAGVPAGQRQTDPYILPLSMGCCLSRWCSAAQRHRRAGKSASDSCPAGSN